MNDVAVTRIKERNFQVLSCYSIADCQSDKVIFNNTFMKYLLDPLKEDQNDGAFIKETEKLAKDFLLKYLEKAPEIILLNFKNKKEKEYSIAFQKVGSVVFAFLLTPLSDAELHQIEKNATGKTYLTGDPSDAFTTKEDFIQ